MLASLLESATILRVAAVLVSMLALVLELAARAGPMQMGMNMGDAAVRVSVVAPAQLSVKATVLVSMMSLLQVSAQAMVQAMVQAMHGMVLLRLLL